MDFSALLITGRNIFFPWQSFNLFFDFCSKISTLNPHWWAAWQTLLGSFILPCKTCYFLFPLEAHTCSKSIKYIHLLSTDVVYTGCLPELCNLSSRMTQTIPLPKFLVVRFHNDLYALVHLNCYTCPLISFSTFYFILSSIDIYYF